MKARRPSAPFPALRGLRLVVLGLLFLLAWRLWGVG